QTFFCLFCLCIRRSPTLSVFPYTTLFLSIYSYVLHIFILGLASLFVAPIYNQTLIPVPFIVFLLFLFALKGLNLWVKWVVDYDRDRKSTRLNSSHVKISYAVTC